MTVPARLRTDLCRFCLSSALLLTLLGDSLCQSNVSVHALVPAEHEVIGEDQYVCFRVDLPRESLKIVGVDPLSTQDVVHHMLLFGTSTRPMLQMQSCANLQSHIVAACNQHTIFHTRMASTTLCSIVVLLLPMLITMLLQMSEHASWHCMCMLLSGSINSESALPY